MQPYYAVLLSPDYKPSPTNLGIIFGFVGVAAGALFVADWISQSPPRKPAVVGATNTYEIKAPRAPGIKGDDQYSSCRNLVRRIEMDAIRSWKLGGAPSWYRPKLQKECGIVADHIVESFRKL